MSLPYNTQGANTYLSPCPVIQPFLLISNITQSNPCTVTVTAANTYVAGQIVKFSVPPTYGMGQINGLSGEILGVNGLDFVVALDTTLFNAFVVPTPGTRVLQPASLSPSGSRNLYNITTVPFHSAGNFGN